MHALGYKNLEVVGYRGFYVPMSSGSTFILQYSLNDDYDGNTHGKLRGEYTVSSRGNDDIRVVVPTGRDGQKLAPIDVELPLAQREALLREIAEIEEDAAAAIELPVSVATRAVPDAVGERAVSCASNTTDLVPILRPSTDVKLLMEHNISVEERVQSELSRRFHLALQSYAQLHNIKITGYRGMYISSSTHMGTFLVQLDVLLPIEEREKLSRALEQLAEQQRACTHL